MLFIQDAGRSGAWMKDNMPRSLIQIHYHNRPGGVSTVIKGYSFAFKRLFFREGLTKNILICDAYNNYSADVQIYALRECAYHLFRSKNSFERTRSRLHKKLRNLLSDPEIPRPVCVIFHNPTLGKNTALTAAVNDCAKYFLKTDEDIRFFWMIHDFAEEGRTALMSSILGMEKKGLKLRELIYPSLKNVCYLVNNRRNLKLLKYAGIKAVFLQNPFTDTNTWPSIKTGKRPLSVVHDALSRLASEQNKSYFPERPVVFYPVRVISRKNIIEAVLSVCCILKGNLILGEPGTSPNDRTIYRKTDELCIRSGLPVIFNAAQIGLYPGKSYNSEKTIKKLYSVCDCSISTSVAEGYGYTFYNSWLHGKGVIGRVPMGFSSFYGLKMDYMYDRFPVPAKWVNVEKLADMYYRLMKRLYKTASGEKGKRAFVEKFVKTSLISDKIDFGMLDTESQISVLKKIAGQNYMEKDIGDISAIVKDQYKNVDSRTESGRELISANRKRAVKGPVNMKVFDRQFSGCLHKKSDKNNRKLNYRKICRYFNDLSNFKVILS